LSFLQSSAKSLSLVQNSGSVGQVSLIENFAAWTWTRTLRNKISQLQFPEEFHGQQPYYESHGNEKLTKED